MASESLPKLDWSLWLARWDTMMAGIRPDREARFAFMLDCVEEMAGAALAALDLGAGPGSMYRRLLDRFPAARCVALDWDPVMLAIGRGAHGDMGGRLTWVEANLAEDGWPNLVGEGVFDLAISTSAFHSLPSPLLAGVYERAIRVLRPGAVLLNGDTMEFGPHHPRLDALAKSANARRRAVLADDPVAGKWEHFREALATEPDMGPLYEERRRRFAWRGDAWPRPTLDQHLAAMRDAGFSDYGVVWQHLDDVVLLAVR